MDIYSRVESPVSKQFRAGEYRHDVARNEKPPQDPGEKGIPPKEILGHRPAMDLAQHAPSEQLGNGPEAEVTPIALQIERDVDMNDLGAGTQHEQREMQGAEDDSRDPLQRVFPAPLAANLEMQQLVIACQIGGQEHPHVGRHAAESFQGRTEQNDLVLTHLDCEAGLHELRLLGIHDPVPAPMPAQKTAHLSRQQLAQYAPMPVIEKL